MRVGLVPFASFEDNLRSEPPELVQQDALAVDVTGREDRGESGMCYHLGAHHWS